MALQKHLDSGLDSFLDNNPTATDDQINTEANRLKNEYNQSVSPAGILKDIQPSTTPVAGHDVSIGGMTPEQKMAEYQKIPAGERREFMGMKVPGAVTSGMERLYPRTTKSQVMGEGMGAASLVSDAMAAPQVGYLEGAAEVGQQLGIPIDKEAMRSGLPYQMATDPWLVPSGLTGGVGLAAKGASPFAKMVGQGAVGMTSQLPASILQQAAEAEQGGEFDPSQVGQEAGIAGGISSGLPLVGYIAKGAGHLAKEAVGAAANVPVSTLQKINFNPVKTLFDNTFKRQDQIAANPNKIMTSMKNAQEQGTDMARKLVSEAQNFERNYIKENPIIIEAVKEMGSTDVMPILKKIDSMRKIGDSGYLKPNEKKFNRQIDELMREYSAGGREISYDKMLQKRRDLDQSINYQKYSQLNPSLAGDLQKLSKGVADHLRKSLVEGAERTGVKEYVPTMKSMANKYDASDRINEVVGKGGNQTLKTQQAHNLLRKVNAEANAAKKEVLEDMSVLIGDDKFMDHADMLEMAEQWGKASKVTGEGSFMSGARQFLKVPEVGAGIVGGLDYMGDMSKKAFGQQQQYQPTMINQLGLQPEGSETVLRR